MPRRVTLAILAAVLLGAAAPAAAQAVQYTVDGAAPGPGCDAARLCRTVTAAVAAVADGDTITVRPGTYTEAGTITLARANVTLQGTTGKVTITAASVTAGAPTFSLAQGDVLDGITVGTAVNAGPGVLVTGRDVTFRNGTIARLTASTQDSPALKVDPAVPAGTTTLKSSVVLNSPAGSSGQTQPAVSGNGTSTLALADTLVVSGNGQGPALGLTGNDKAVDGTPVANTVTRTSLVATKPSADALSVSGAANDPLKKAVTLDSAVLIGGSSGAGMNVRTAGTLLPAGQDTAGDVKVVATHVTIAGSDRPFVVDAASGGQTPVGNIDVTIDRSIVHGRSQGSVASFTPATPIVLVSGTANTARVVVSNSDTTQNPVGASSDKATVTVPGRTVTPDAGLFVNLAAFNVHLRADAPAIDRGGAPVAGESGQDIDGQPRLTGPATDLGADEFLNRAPTASATASPDPVAQNAPVTFDAARSSDPEGASGGGLVAYRWAFGDGSTQETTTPTTTHAYTARGSYNATITVVDRQGGVSGTSAIPAITVQDGTAPVARLSAPTSGKVFRIFTTRRVRRGGRTVRVRTLSPQRVAKVVFAGTASDDVGLRSVELSVRRVSVTRTGTARAAATTCVYLDGKTRFRRSSCAKPVFFLVRLGDGAFRYRFKRTLKPRAGRYIVTARATDTSGLISKPARASFTLK